MSKPTNPGSPIDFSEAQVAYLGSGLTIYPDRDPKRLSKAHGPLQAADVVVSSNRVLDELSSMTPYRPTESLAETTDRALAAVTRSHPELSDEALALLRWKYSYDWRWSP